MAVRLCPTCGKPVKQGEKCLRCDKPICKRKNHGTKTPEQERRRVQSEPWREHYKSPEYKRARQAVIARQMGCCARCGVPVAHLDLQGGGWRTGRYGGVHHKVALSEGGTDDVSNLVLLCVKCHNEIDAQRRARSRN